MNVLALIRRLQVRLRADAALLSSAAGLAALACGTAVGAVLGNGGPGAIAGLIVGAIIIAAGVRHAWRSWTPLRTAGWAEARVSGLDNLLVTAVELSVGPGRGSPQMRAEIERQAADRATLVVPSAIAPLGRSVVIAALVALAAGAMVWSLLRTPSTAAERTTSAESATADATLGSVTVTVTPPSYIQRAPETIEDPEQVSVTAGGSVRIRVSASTARVWMEDPATGTRPLERSGDAAFSTEWQPRQSGAIVVAAGSAVGAAVRSRLLVLSVVPDAAPRVRVVAPGRDLAFTTPDHTVEVALEAEDLEGLTNLELRYTRMSGSGESFEFAEGQVPVQVSRVSPGRWTARAAWSLRQLELEDGDSLVYRAMARDTNPDADWVPSESFTIDIGKRLEFAGAGFAVPDEDRRYAISQQMVIVKTERLQAERGKHDAESWAEQTRFLAIEQRMVRSEVVFLSGGEVEDEVAEAEHSHELQEGRLENAGRAEMLRAINDMSRAEARLNAGDTVEALVFERAALKALQRAFDRRRYFLRTLPERARIDTGRRLTGDRKDARSFTRPGAPTSEDTVETERALMAELVALAASDDAATPGLLARLAALDTNAPDWRKAVAALASADSELARTQAVKTAMNLVASRARRKLAPAGAESPPENRELMGWWADEMRARSPR